MHRRLFLTLAACVLCLAAPARAERPQNTSRDVVGQSLDEIIDRGFIEIGVYNDFPPYSWEENGEARGIDVEIGRVIAASLGVESRFVSFSADESVDSDLRNNVWRGPLIGDKVVNVMMRVPYNRDLAIRNELVVLTGQYQNEKIAIAYDEAFYEDAKPVPAYFRYDKVGVENDSIADFYLAGIGRGTVVPNMVRYRTPALAMAGLKAGEVRAVMGARGQLEWSAGDGIAVHEPALPGLSVGQWTIGVAVRMNWRALGYAADDAIRAAAEDGTIAKIFADHGLTWAPPVW